MCDLHVSGRAMDPSVGAPFAPYRVFRVGELRRPSRLDGPRWNTSGFSVAVSDASWSDLRTQVSDACAFLDRNRNEIETLRATGAVEDMRLDFPVDLRIGKKVVVQFEFFPAELVARAGVLGLGLELSIYPSGQEDEEMEHDVAKGW